MTTSDLSKIFECAAGIQLGRVNNIELILLKGHLLLEVAMNNAISKFSKRKVVKCKDLSFSKKLKVLESLQPYIHSDLKQALLHLEQLNRLRNRLAHEFMFDGGPEDLGRWSEAVLKDFPGTKVCRHTFRTKIIQAIGALGSVVVDPKSEL
ncbi:hypothetical protein [Geobacter anodireducens]|uniref:hypothetical protein n=1 Tax=Geobacter soli TaxID=1510391 RepID=UPI00126A707F|nr:hypothetical protein [Geobacter soli]